MKRYAVCCYETTADEWTVVEITKYEFRSRQIARELADDGFATKIVTDFCVNHINGNPLDNSISNLELVPAGLNSKYSR